MSKSSGATRVSGSTGTGRAAIASGGTKVGSSSTSFKVTKNEVSDRYDMSKISLKKSDFVQDKHFPDFYTSKEKVFVPVMDKELKYINTSKILSSSGLYNKGYRNLEIDSIKDGVMRVTVSEKEYVPGKPYKHFFEISVEQKVTPRIWNRGSRVELDIEPSENKEYKTKLVYKGSKIY